MLQKFQKFFERLANAVFGSVSLGSVSEINKILGEDPEDEERQEFDRKTTLDKVSLELQQKINKDKRAFFEKSLESGVATLYLDPRVIGTVVPQKFAGSSTLVLNYSYNYHISDFFFDDFAVVASLSFNRTPFRCIIPWNAVFGIGNQGEGIFCQFSEIPADANIKSTVLSPLEGGKKSETENELQNSKREKPKFTVIKGGKED